MTNLNRYFRNERDREPLVSRSELVRFMETHAADFSTDAAFDPTRPGTRNPGGTEREGAEGGSVITDTATIPGRVAIMTTLSIGFLAAIGIGLYSLVGSSDPVQGLDSRGVTDVQVGEKSAGRFENGITESGLHGRLPAPDGMERPTDVARGSSAKGREQVTPYTAGKEKRNSKVESEGRDSSTDMDARMFLPPAPSVHGIKTLELDEIDLGRLGLQKDTAGVWNFYRTTPGGGVEGIQITISGVMFAPDLQAHMKPGTEAPTFYPALITDDVGNQRMERFVDEEIVERDEALARMLEQYRKEQGRPLTDVELRKQEEVFRSQLSQERLASGKYVPVLVRTGRDYTGEDKANGRWRPDCIFWFEPKPEFLAALPESVRRQIERELRLATVLERKPASERVEDFLLREAPEFKDMLKAEDRGDRSGETDRPAGVAGEGVLGMLSSASGAVTSATISPNPAKERATVDFQLASPRRVSCGLYDVRGGLVKALFEAGEARDPGAHSVPIDLEGVARGMYLMVLATDKEERAVQRLIVR